MGCAASFHISTTTTDDDPMVSLCRDRKRLIKSTLDRRYTLALSHSKYTHSLYALALALRLFISRHSLSSSSNFLITFPVPAPSPNPPLHQHHTQSNPIGNKKQDEDTDNSEEDGEGTVCDHFYDDDDVNNMVGPTETVNNNNNNSKDYGGWDFFNMFDDYGVNCGGDKVGEDKVTEVVSHVLSPTNDGRERELLEALKHVEDYFLKAYHCGVEFSKMLEFNHVGPLDHLELKESSEKFIPAITWHKSTITRSPLCRSLLSSSSRNSFSLTGSNINVDLFDETGGMESGSHLSTLGRLYAWEKKLYDEVKAGNEMRKIYDRKSSQISSEEASKKQEIEDQVNDLYSRILVNLKICNSISKRIEKVRDDELLPQIVELLRGLTKTWKTMLESHKAQSRIMFEVKSFPCADPTNDKSRYLSTLQLEAEIQNWQACFSSYISSMEAYVEALTHWAYRTAASEPEVNAPPLVFTICRDWSNVMKNLPTQAVTFAMKRFAKDLRTLWAHQETEHQQKRKVDRLVAESAKRVVGIEKEERNAVNHKSMNVKNKVEALAEKKAQLEVFTNMVEIEKAKHKACVEETRRIVLVGFQTGFSSVFDSLTEFSEVCVKKYNEVAQNATLGPNLVRGI